LLSKLNNMERCCRPNFRRRPMFCPYMQQI